MSPPPSPRLRSDVANARSHHACDHGRAAFDEYQGSHLTLGMVAEPPQVHQVQEVAHARLLDTGTIRQDPNCLQHSSKTSSTLSEMSCHTAQCSPAPIPALQEPSPPGMASPHLQTSENKPAKRIECTLQPRSHHRVTSRRHGCRLGDRIMDACCASAPAPRSRRRGRLPQP